MKYSAKIAYIELTICILKYQIMKPYSDSLNLCIEMEESNKTSKIRYDSGEWRVGLFPFLVHLSMHSHLYKHPRTKMTNTCF
jgi:hypothetical protein